MAVLEGFEQEHLDLVYREAVQQEAIARLDESQYWYCWWCWSWGYVVYEYDMLGMPLCEQCSLRYLLGLTPPWYPNHEQRCELHVRRLFEVQAEDTVYMLPGEVCDRVAGFLAEPWRP